MKEPSSKLPDWHNQRQKIIGLGESSIRKSYYPELQQRLSELEETNQSLLDAFEEIQCKEEELRHQFEEQEAIQASLDFARKKLQMLNIITFQDIQNALFSMSGFLSLVEEQVTGEKEKEYLALSIQQLEKTERLLHAAKHYQDLGMAPPAWQNVMDVFLFAVSHLDLSHLSRDLHLEELFIFADPLLEDAFFSILENIPIHSTSATLYRAWYEERGDEVCIIIEDNGPGIPAEKKDEIFSRESGINKGLGLFLSQEILAITGITCTERGEYGTGARFEILVPKGKYKFSQKRDAV